MFKAFEVVDGFYGDAERVRSLALRSGRWTTGNGVSRETENSFWTDEIVERFRDLVGAPIVVDPVRMGFGVFAFYPGDVDVRDTTHFDDTDWSAIVYLVPDDQCAGGLSFYRHRATGLHGPPSDEQARALGFESRDDFVRNVYHPDKHRHDAWERTAHVNMRFNRMVLLRGSRLFHRASSGFGSGPADGRLTQRFFFDDARPGGQDA